MNSSSDQDWETRVIKKTSQKKTTDEKLKSGEMKKITRKGLNKNSETISSKSDNDFDPENITKPVTSTLELKLAIQQARTTKKWTQFDLDKACNFPSGTTRDYENGSAVIKPDQLNKLNRALGVKLPRPAKERLRQIPDLARASGRPK
jgi:putative transcription factor